MATFLGMDAGGTRSRWVLLDETEPLARGEGGPVQASQGVAAATGCLQRELQAVLVHVSQRQQPELALAGVAGAGDPDVAAQLARGVAVPFPVRVVGDVVVAAAVALRDGAGVALWSGTGSFAVARDANGALARRGGRGALLGDDGSAYDVARRAARAVVRAADALGSPTALREPLCAFFGETRVERLGARLATLTPGAIAAAFPLVCAAAEHRDAVARTLLHDGARALAHLAHTTAGAAGLEPARTTVTLGGGALEPPGRYLADVRAQLAAKGFPPPRVATCDAALGAALLARACARHEQPFCRWVDHGPA